MSETDVQDATFQCDAERCAVSLQLQQLALFENLYSPHNSDSSSDKINTKLYNKNTKKK